MTNFNVHDLFKVTSLPGSSHQVIRVRDNLVSCSQDNPSPPGSPHWRSQDEDEDICGVSSSTADDVEVDERQQQQSTSGSSARVKTETSSAATTSESVSGASRSPQPGPSGSSFISTQSLSRGRIKNRAVNSVFLLKTFFSDVRGPHWTLSRVWCLRLLLYLK